MITPECSRPMGVDKIGPGGIAKTVEATPQECAALAKRFGVPGVVSLACDFVLRRGDDATRGEVVADGALRAVLIRVCVVSLEEFEQPMGGHFRVRFVGLGTEREDIPPDEDDEIPYEGNTVDLGEAAAEQVALDLDPYPHSPGVAFPDESGDPLESPFAALLRRTDSG